jgi:hypothetical protein
MALGDNSNDITDRESKAHKTMVVHHAHEVDVGLCAVVTSNLRFPAEPEFLCPSRLGTWSLDTTGRLDRLKVLLNFILDLGSTGSRPLLAMGRPARSGSIGFLSAGGFSSGDVRYVLLSAAIFDATKADRKAADEEEDTGDNGDP